MKRTRLILLLALVSAGFVSTTDDAVAAQHDTTLVSRVPELGVPGDKNSVNPSVSADGRFVAFTSEADSLVADDDKDVEDVFLRDRSTGVTTLVSRATGVSGAASDAESSSVSISADGRYVTFSTKASNLDPAADGSDRQVFVRDVVANTTTLVSRASGATGSVADIDASSGVISGDGRYVVFSSYATNLDADSIDYTTVLYDGQEYSVETLDVFRRDLVTDTTILVSRASGGAGAPADSTESIATSISPDGRYVVFTSNAMNLDADSNDETYDVFVRDVQAATTTLVTRASGVHGVVGDAHSWGGGAISSDGRFVAFTSEATNLDPHSDDAVSDVFVRDLTTATTTLVSRATGVAGAVGDGRSYVGAISADGRYVAFSSDATNLGPGYDWSREVFVRDLATATTTLVSRASGADGAPGWGHSSSPAMSADGGLIAFDSSAEEFDPEAFGGHDVYVRDMAAVTTALVSRATASPGAADAASSSVSVSADGRYVAFSSAATDLDATSSDFVGDVFVRDTVAGSVRLVSKRSNGNSYEPVISGDGRYVAFTSDATSLHWETNDSGYAQVFVYDLVEDRTRIVSENIDDVLGNGDSSGPSISADGTKIAFTSFATNLDEESVDGASNVFVRRMNVNAEPELASRATYWAGAPADNDSSDAAISADGTTVAFTSWASNLDAESNDAVTDVFVRNLATDRTNLVSRGDGSAGPVGNNHAYQPSISGDGRRVAFTSRATNLDNDAENVDDDAVLDVFVRDLVTNESTLVSRASGANSAGGRADSSDAAISGDGRYVAFSSAAGNIAAHDNDAVADVFLRDVLMQSTTLVSRASGVAGAAGNGASSAPFISASGRWVAFASAASNLDPVDDNGVSDVFVRDVLGSNPLPAITIDDVAVEEGDPGRGGRPGTVMTFTVTLTGDNAETATLRYETVDGTAVASSDYTAATGTVSFAPGTGERTRTLKVVVSPDARKEQGERFTLRLSAASGAVIADGDGAGYILDDDNHFRAPTK